MTVLILAIFSSHLAVSQTTAEKLGYAKDDILLILHADDLGVSHSENKASFDALMAGAVNSASIMVPTPWFKEVVEFSKLNPEFDLGLHLTLTAEWENLKWDGVSSSGDIPSLLDANGYLPSTVVPVVQNGKLIELEKEITAQVQRALDVGLKPTHLDSHMGTLFQKPEFFKIYQEVGRKFKIPVMIPYGAIAQTPLAKEIAPNQIVVDQITMFDGSTPAEEWKMAYLEIIKNLKPGLNEIIVHLAYDNEEMQAVTVNHPAFGSAWRQRDLEVMMDDDFKSLIKQRNIKLVTWREIQKIQYSD